MSFHRRSPRKGPLKELYDEGCAAARAGTPSPYKPARERGDETRHHIWNQGFEDETEAMGIEDLV